MNKKFRDQLITSMTWMIEVLKHQFNEVKDPMGVGGTGGYSLDIEQSILLLSKLRNIEAWDEQTCKDIGNMIGMTDQKSSEFYHHYNSQGWMKPNGLRITDVNSAMVLWKNRQYRFEDEDARPEPQTRTGPTARERDIAKEQG